MAQKEYIAVKRIKNELKDFENVEDDECGVSVEVVNDSFVELKGQIFGPPNTPYEGGNFALEIKVPESYPFNPLNIRFVTKIWHPNINSVTGEICLVQGDWVASMTLKKVLLSLQALLSSAEPDDPQDAVVTKQYKEDPEIFWLTARYWAQLYAGAPGSNLDFDIKVKRLMRMGVEADKAVAALSCCSWDLEKAALSFFS